MLSLRVKACYGLMGADIILALFFAAAHDPRFVFFVGLAALMNWMGGVIFESENHKENQ